MLVGAADRGVDIQVPRDRPCASARAWNRVKIRARRRSAATGGTGHRPGCIQHCVTTTGWPFAFVAAPWDDAGQTASGPPGASVIRSVFLTPTPLVRGQRETLTLEADFAEAITGGTVRVALKYGSGTPWSLRYEEEGTATARHRKHLRGRGELHAGAAAVGRDVEEAVLLVLVDGELPAEFGRGPLRRLPAQGVRGRGQPLEGVLVGLLPVRSARVRGFFGCGHVPTRASIGAMKGPVRTFAAPALGQTRLCESRVTVTRSAGQGPFARSDSREGTRRWDAGEAGAAEWA